MFDQSPLEVPGRGGETMPKPIPCHAARNSVLSAAAEWLHSQGMIDGHTELHVYPDLGRHPKATVLAGTGRLADGRDVEFVADVIEGEGVHAGLVLEPGALAGCHELAAAVARESGQALIDVIEQMLLKIPELVN